MSIDLRPVVRPVRVPWNTGRIIGQKRPVLPRHVWSIRVRLEMAGNAHDLPLFGMAVDRKLRGCDLVALRVRDVFAAGRVKGRASMIQSKTGKPVRFEITQTTRASLERWIGDPEMNGLEVPWSSHIHGSPHLWTRQHARIVRGWVTSPGLEPSACGTHSMRPTKVAQIDKKTGNLRALQLLPGHTPMDSTVRYLGVEIEAALSLSEGIDPSPTFKTGPPSQPGIARALSISVPPGRALAAAFVPASANDAFHIGLHDQLNDGFGNAAQKVSLIVLGQKLGQVHVRLGHSAPWRDHGSIMVIGILSGPWSKSPNSTSTRRLDGRTGSHRRQR